VTPETVAAVSAVVVALAGLVAAITQLVIEVKRLHSQINGRVDELLELTRLAAHEAGAAQAHIAAVAERLGTSTHTDVGEIPTDK
jgi:hypothetical protein